MQSGTFPAAVAPKPLRRIATDGGLHQADIFLRNASFGAVILRMVQELDGTGEDIVPRFLHIHVDYRQREPTAELLRPIEESRFSAEEGSPV